MLNLKKKEPVENIETKPVEETNVGESKETIAENERVKRFLARKIEAYAIYGNAFSAQDLANMTDAEFRAELLSLQFAVFSELLELLAALKQATQ